VSQTTEYSNKNN